MSNKSSTSATATTTTTIKDKDNENNNNNKTEPKKEVVEEKITIPKKEYDELKKHVDVLTKKLVNLKINLDRFGGALIQMQGEVYNTKNSI